MLVRFRFTNFRSFKEEQELSLVAGSLKEAADGVARPSAIPEGILPLAGIYGANASGKTNVIKALQFMVSAVESSYRQWKPDASIAREPFRADGTSAAAASEFVTDLILDGVRYQYGFRLDSDSILAEWLHAYPKGKRQTWFDRKQGSPISFSSKMPGENRTIENLTRNNCLFLSAAAQNNHEALLPVYKWFSNSISFVTGFRPFYLEQTVALCTSAGFKENIEKLVAAADLGIAGMEVQERKVSDHEQKLYDALAAGLKAAGLQDAGGTTFQAPESRRKIRLLHRIGSTTAPFENEEESDGTITYLGLLGPVLHALSQGALLCVDELDASLHPLLALQLMRLFSNSSSNPRGAQMIFNTHDTNLLNSGVLRRDEIWFTEKNADGASQLYPLTDFKPRREEKLQSGYLQGRYGAIPFVNSDAFLLDIEGTNEKG